MKIHRRILQAVRESRPGWHSHFREWCALAAAGHLGGPQMVELNEHLVDCAACREFLQSITSAFTRVIPATAADQELSEAEIPPAGMRARFLSRLTAEINRTEQPAPLVLVHSGETTFKRSAASRRAAASQGDSTSIRRTGWLLPASCAAAAILICATVGAMSFHIGKVAGRANQIVLRPAADSISQTAPNVPSADSERLAELEQDKTAIESEVLQLNAALAQSRSDRQFLNEQLAEARAQLADLNVQVSTSRQARDSSSLREPRSEIGALQSSIDTLTLKLADSEAKATAQQRLNDDITAKLATTEAELHRERELQSARLEVSDLVAARNLHIVDVYDSDGKGKRQQAFGRVFYTEGKSLVFYAYDLQDTHRVDANVVFHVWGEKAGLKPVAHSLGLLRSDGPRDGRWSMTFDDPAILAQINSVFVTVEGTDKNASDPRGRKVLYAYFGNAANHP